MVRERGDAVPAPGVPPRGGREPRALREQRPVEPRPGSAALEPCWRPCAECVAPEGDRELCKQERTPSDLVFRGNRAAKLPSGSLLEASRLSARLWLSVPARLLVLSGEATGVLPFSAVGRPELGAFLQLVGSGTP